MTHPHCTGHRDPSSRWIAPRIYRNLQLFLFLFSVVVIIAVAAAVVVVVVVVVVVPKYLQKSPVIIIFIVIISSSSSSSIISSSSSSSTVVVQYELPHRTPRRTGKMDRSDSDGFDRCKLVQHQLQDTQSHLKIKLYRWRITSSDSVIESTTDLQGEQKVTTQTSRSFDDVYWSGRRTDTRWRCRCARSRNKSHRCRRERTSWWITPQPESHQTTLWRRGGWGGGHCPSSAQHDRPLIWSAVYFDWLDSFDEKAVATKWRHILYR